MSLKIGNTSFSESAVEQMKGKTVEEILEMHPSLHPRIAQEFVKIHKPVKKPLKPKAKKEKESNDE